MLRKPLLKVLACIMIAAMLICSLPIYISASEYTATGTTPDGFEYGIVMDNQATITGYSGLFADGLVIPTEINGYRVTVIGNSAFKDAPIVGDLVIPEGIWIIEDFAFDGCNEITSLYIPESVYGIRTNSFNNCTGIKSIVVDSNNDTYDSRENCNAIIDSYRNELVIGCDNTIIPDTVTKIGDFAFANCKDMESIVIPNSVTGIGSSAFNECYSLKTIEIPESVTYINPYTFKGCTYLESVILPVNINFAWYSFEHCYNLRDVYYRGTEAQWRNIIIPEYNECLLNANVHYNYGNNNVDYQGIIYELDERGEFAIITAYMGTTNHIIIPSSIDGHPVAYIDEYAFEGCDNLESVVIEEGIFDISEYAFAYCTNLKSVVLPESLMSIDNYAFHFCTSLQEITLPDSIEHLGSDIFLNCHSLESATLPNNLTEIPANMFYDCPSLANVTLPDELTYIGASAFCGCTGLKSITLPEKVTTIGSNAFENCTNLESITIPDSVTNIEFRAFYGNTSLTDIFIPENVTNIDLYAFSACSAITSIAVDENNKVYDSRNNCNAIIETASDKLIAGCVNTVIPEDVKALQNGAFEGCSKLESITIPQSVTEIGAFAFENCTSLRSMVIPDTVTFLGGRVFDNCTNLENITLSKNISNIGSSCFSDCSSLKSITIPENVTSIYSYAFNNCTNLETINIPKAVTSIGSYAFKGCKSIKSIEIPEGVTVIERETFANCKSLTEVILPEGIERINYGAFDYCSSLESIKIPESVTNIGMSAFGDCKSLKSITIPSNVKNIESYAFMFCTVLEDVTVSEGTESLGESVFSNCTSLKSIKLPSTLKSIGTGSFKLCDSLTDVYFNGTEEQWDAITVGVNNDCLLNATIHFADEPEETTAAPQPETTVELTTASQPAEVTTIATEATEPTETVIASEPETEATTDEVDPSESVTDVTTKPTEESTVVTEAEKAYYTVVFVDYDGKLINAQTVNNGESALAPENPVRTGYTFAGWDTDFDVVKSDLTVKAQYTRNSIPVSKATTGPLKVEIVGGTGFYISLNDSTPRPQGATFVNSKLEIGTKVTLTAFSSADSEFMGWINPDTGTVLSESETYSFISTGNDYVKASYKSVIEGINMVAFKNGKAAGGNGQILDMQYYAAGDEVVTPDAPNSAGYSFAGWDKSQEDIQAELEASRDVTVLANWTLKETYITVAVKGGMVNGADSADVIMYFKTTVEADTPESGKKFAYWVDEAGKVVSYDSVYSFYPSSDTFLTAVFTEEDTAISYQPLVALDADPTNEGEIITYILSWNINESIGTVTNAGLMIVNKNDFNADTFYHGTEDKNVFDRALGSAQISQSNSYGIVKHDSLYDNTYCACTWVQYTDAATGETITVYSDIAEITKFS